MPRIFQSGPYATLAGRQVRNDADRLYRQFGRARKLVKTVEQISYSGSQARKRGHVAFFVTVLAVFSPTPQGLVLTQVAPGIDIRKDILDVMNC